MATQSEQRATTLSDIGLDTQNKASIGRVLGTGKIEQAKEGPDGRMSATIRIQPDQLVFEPSVLVLPHGGDLDLELINDDHEHALCAACRATGTASSSGW